MTFANIFRLGLDWPRMTPQQIADQALAADQEARRLARIGDSRAEAVQKEAWDIASVCARRFWEN